LLVVKEQGQAEHHAHLHLDQRLRVTAVCGEIEDRRLALEVIFSKKEETATQAETATPTIRHHGFVVKV
jgi:acyl-CoA thioesterase FadM